MHHERTSHGDAWPVLHWPPVLGPDGLVLRRTSRTATETGMETRSCEPWLVRTDGTVTVIPVELAVSPLTHLPGAGWLLPGSSALWRDDYNEPLHRLSEGGDIEPFLLAGRPVTPHSVVLELAPELTTEAVPVFWEGGDARWSFHAAAMCPDGSSFLLLLADGDVSDPEPVSWLVASLPTDGSRGPTRVAAGTAREEQKAVAIAAGV